MGAIRVLIAVEEHLREHVTEMVRREIQEIRPGTLITWQYYAGPDLRSGLTEFKESTDLLICCAAHARMIESCAADGCDIMPGTCVICISEPASPRHVTAERRYIPHHDHLEFALLPLLSTLLGG